MAKTAAWTRSEGKDPKGGLNRKGVASYRRANPGSKLKMAVTTKPSKLDPDSKPAKRRKSFFLVMCSKHVRYNFNFLKSTNCRRPKLFMWSINKSTKASHNV